MNPQLHTPRVYCHNPIKWDLQTWHTINFKIKWKYIVNYVLNNNYDFFLEKWQLKNTRRIGWFLFEIRQLTKSQVFNHNLANLRRIKWYFNISLYQSMKKKLYRLSQTFQQCPMRFINVYRKDIYRFCQLIKNIHHPLFTHI